MFTTAEDSFNVFRPNLDPDFESQGDGENPEGVAAQQKFEEEKQGSSTGDQTVESEQRMKQPVEYAIDTDEDMEDEEKRIIATARQLNKQRRARSKSRVKNGLKRKRV